MCVFSVFILSDPSHLTPASVSRRTHFQTNSASVSQSVYKLVIAVEINKLTVVLLKDIAVALMN